MNFIDLYYIIGTFLRVKCFNQRIPLIVGWALTYRCDNKCVYCGAWQGRETELNTQDVFRLVDELESLGTKWISFTGGEPLLRNDIDEIIDYVCRKRIRISVNTNGIRVPQKIKTLRKVDLVKISLDGPADIHDFIRGQGSFARAIDAVRICKDYSVPVCGGCVLTKHNLGYLDCLLAIALRYKIKVSFQPATVKILRLNVNNPHVPEHNAYKEAVRKLLEYKRKGGPIYNSKAGLEYIYYYPDFKKLQCYAGRLSFRLEPDGTILACDRFFTDKKAGNTRGKLLREQISGCFLPDNCGKCWCGSIVESNLMFQFNFSAIANFFINHT